MKIPWHLGILVLLAGTLFQAATKPASKPTAKPSVSETYWVEAGRVTYQQQCSYCHQPKALNSLPNFKAWKTLVYSSSCPQVTVRLTDLQRKQLLIWIESEFKKVQTVK